MDYTCVAPLPSGREGVGFSLDPTDAITLRSLGFRRSDRLLAGRHPTGSVIAPETRTQIEIRSTSAHGNFMQIEVRPAR